MTDSDDQLQDMLMQYQERVGHLQAKAEEERRRLNELGRELQRKRESLSANEREFGSHEAQKANYERQIELREQLVKQTARKHNIRGFELDVGDEEVVDFIDKITRMAKEQNTAFERARRETQQLLQQAQTTLNQINEQKSALHQKKESARASTQANDRRITNFQSDLDKIEMDEGSKAVLESAIADTQAKLRTAKADYDVKGWDQQVVQVESQLRSLDDQKEKLDTEVLQASKQASETAQLDYIRKEVKVREHSLQTMTGAHGAKIDEAIGTGWHPSTLESEFQGCVDRSGNLVTEAERQREGTTRELDQVDFRLKKCRSDLKTKRIEFASSERKLREVLGGDSDPAEYPSELEKAEDARDEVASGSTYAVEYVKYLKGALSFAEEKKCCKMCQRGYSGTRDANNYEMLLGLLRGQISRAEAALDPKVLEDAESDLQVLKDLRPTYDIWKRLREEDIPTLTTEESQLKSRHDTLTSQADIEDREVEERRNAKRDLESLSKTVQNIVKYSNEVAKLQADIEQLSQQQKHFGLSRGVEAIQEDLKKINEQSRMLKMSLTKIVGDRDGARSVINSLELELRDNSAKLSTAVYQLREKTSLEMQVNDLKTQNAEHRNSINAVDEQLRALGPQLEQAQARYDDIAQRGAEKDRHLRAEMTSLEGSVNELKMATREIEDYINRDGPVQLERCKTIIENLKEDIARIQKEMSDVTQRINRFDSDLRDVEDTKRQIADNQDYRRDVNALRDLTEEIEELESHNAEAEKAQYEREGNRWEMERNRLVADQASIMGQVKSKDDQLQKLIADWDTDYKGAAEKYKEAHIKVETTKAAVEDLLRYGGALDKAVMKYHSLKMEEINRIIEELWRKTYQGTDVDTIMIRSDNENVKGNKTYNYRVVMVKQDTEMDMRGRCSAGQKVLASIIIRLALAECFGVNCGLIALDEPTTNLDRDNIRALAESLAEIIRVRRQQRNFQLIVITHDEEFLRYMQCADFCDYYYRVSRDERQKSIIVRQNIGEVSFDFS